jgi:hypothetical protein
MNIRINQKEPRYVLTLGTALILLCAGRHPALALDAQANIFQTNVTNNLALASGEPMIGFDPRNPDHLAIIEFAQGSDQLPAYSYDQQDYKNAIKNYKGAMGNAGRVLTSTDGGAHWTPQSTPVIGGDPYLAYGPKGEIYAGSEGGEEPSPTIDLRHVLEFGNLALAVSLDGGKTFSKWQSAGTPIDRPWLVVDQSNGVVFTVSSGSLDLKTGKHNAGGPDAPNDRWLVAWKPRLTAKSEPRRLGGPDFSAAGGSTIAAAHGVVAATFVLGGPAPGAGAPGVPDPVMPPSPVPASLQSLVGGAVTACSMEAPCVFFETSSDQGKTWTRHYVPIADAVNTQRVSVAADPKRPGRYIISALSADRTNFVVTTTTDSGVTWSKPVKVPQATKSVKFKQWMAIGPSGVLGLIWKDRRDDLTPQEKSADSNRAAANRVYEAAFDVYTSISCDGGATWLRPIRVNSEPSPAGPPGSDDFAYMALDSKNALLVWGDRRLQPKVTNVSGGAGGVQTFFGRVPFSIATQGAPCEGK